MEVQQGALMLSSNKGRYAICTTGSVLFENEVYPDLTAGMLIEVCLGGRWIRGSVQYGFVYTAPLPHDDTIGGYYFVASDGSVAGLCIGMKVRIIP